MMHSFEYIFFYENNLESVVCIWIQPPVLNSHKINLLYEKKASVYHRQSSSSVTDLLLLCKEWTNILGLTCANPYKDYTPKEDCVEKHGTTKY